ncbi:competence type IV pilus minor pilin ComGG [Alkalihalobacillus sp. FSL W8-0930]
MNCEKGFAYPVTLLLVAILTLSCLYTIQLYELEKRVVFEQEKLMQMDHLMQMAVVDVLHQPDMVNEKGDFHYEVGSVSYSMHGQSDVSVQVELHGRIGEHHKRWSILHYNKENRTITYFKDMD